jgi:pimeloyl-ACP methyl ester carboxylesterase
MVARVAWKPYMYNRRLEHLLRDVDLPTLVVHGDDDAVIPIECAERYVELLPRSRCAVVADCGHAVDLERPDELCGLIVAHAAYANETD